MGKLSDLWIDYAIIAAVFTAFVGVFVFGLHAAFGH